MSPKGRLLVNLVLVLVFAFSTFMVVRKSQDKVVGSQKYDQALQIAMGALTAEPDGFGDNFSNPGARAGANCRAYF